MKPVSLLEEVIHLCVENCALIPAMPWTFISSNERFFADTAL